MRVLWINLNLKALRVPFLGGGGDRKHTRSRSMTIEKTQEGTLRLKHRRSITPDKPAKFGPAVLPHSREDEHFSRSSVVGPTDRARGPLARSSSRFPSPSPSSPRLLPPHIRRFRRLAQTPIALAKTSRAAMLLGLHEVLQAISLYVATRYCRSDPRVTVLVSML